MALYFCLNEDGTGKVDGKNILIQTKHTSNDQDGKVLPVYIYNDGKRKGVANDENPPPLIYTNVQIQLEGVQHLLQDSVSSSLGTVSLRFESTEGWNIGTVIQSQSERMRIEQIGLNGMIIVQRGYDGTTSQSHETGARFTADKTSVELALPDPNDPTYNTPMPFNKGGGNTLSQGFDPTNLRQAVDAREESRIIKSSNGSRYHVGSLIQIENEVMKIESISGDDLVVFRGWNNTQKAAHDVNKVIYCVGFVDVLVGVDKTKTHKFFLKNTPPRGLPTQKKKDVKLLLIGDEEPI